ncbi:MAG: YjhG/YagF family D-xylonate dehydratase [Dehalococcoidia bacterium]|nr:YjhG/YagF family D-xylonate dehydratase [Dehalococcoidia bacterium]
MDILGESKLNDNSWDFLTHAEGPKGKIEFTHEQLISEPSGNLFAQSQNTGMGWDPKKLWGTQFMILSTLGGMRSDDGEPIALGHHTGHFELGMLIETVANQIKEDDGIPYSAYCSDPCDGRSQGTSGMMDSLPYRNDAAIVMRRLSRSIPTTKGVMGIATCDKGLPAMMMALAGTPDKPTIIVPGGVTLAVEEGEDTAMIQSIGARYAQDEVTLEYAQDMGCKTCASPGGGCQFLGTAGTSQVIAESLGMTLPHAALTPSGTNIWLDTGRRSALALKNLVDNKINTKTILTNQAFENAMIVHAACGGSTNLILHLPAIAHAVKRKMMKVDDWTRINKLTPRLVDVLPNGPKGFPTSVFFSSGGVPEVMLKLRDEGLLNLDVMTASGKTLEENLNWWEQSEKRHFVRDQLVKSRGIDPEDVVHSLKNSKKKNMTSTVTFPKGNIAPEGSVVKSTAIDKTVIDEDGVYRKIGPARIFISEADAIKAVKDKGPNKIKAGDIMVIVCGGPKGTGMQEVAQITIALKYLPYGKEVALITDGRFSGVSTGACIGHIGPEALDGGPIGKLKENDLIEINIDTINLEGSLNLIGENEENKGIDWGSQQLKNRKVRNDLKPQDGIPEDTILWAHLQSLSGGAWNGCVYDYELIKKKSTT